MSREVELIVTNKNLLSLANSVIQMDEYIMDSDPTFMSIEAIQREILSFVFCEGFIK